MAMTDMQYDNIFLNQALNNHNDGVHYDFDQLSDLAFLESHAVAWPIPVHSASSDDIEHIYIELHKWVDQAVAKISVHTPPQLDQIREQNRKLIDKLTTRESKITGDATAVVFGPKSRVSSATSTSDFGGVRNSIKKRRVSQKTRPNPQRASVSSVSPFNFNAKNICV